MCLDNIIKFKIQEDQQNNSIKSYLDNRVLIGKIKKVVDGFGYARELRKWK